MSKYFIDDENQVRECGKCGEIKPFEQFSKTEQGRPVTYCKKCKVEVTMKDYYSYVGKTNRFKDRIKFEWVAKLYAAKGDRIDGTIARMALGQTIPEAMLPMELK